MKPSTIAPSDEHEFIVENKSDEKCNVQLEVDSRYRHAANRQFKSAPRNHFVIDKAGTQCSGLFSCDCSPDSNGNRSELELGYVQDLTV